MLEYAPGTDGFSISLAFQSKVKDLLRISVLAEYKLRLRQLLGVVWFRNWIKFNGSDGPAM